MYHLCAVAILTSADLPINLFLFSSPPGNNTWTYDLVCPTRDTLSLATSVTHTRWVVPTRWSCGL